MTALLQQTIETIHENATLREVIDRAGQKTHIEMWTQTDDGEWISTMVGNEAAALELEAKGRKRGFATRRG